MLASVTLLLVVALASQARAQASTATISGTVRDETGVLPGAAITAKEIQSGFTSEVVSGDLKAEDLVIISDSTQATASNQQGFSLFGGPRGR